MMRFESRHVERFAAAAALCALGMGAAGCDVANASADPGVGVIQQAAIGDELLKQCGLVCPGDTDADGVAVLGVADGNATISGVASVDAFFGSVLKVQDAANSVSSGIQTQLGLIRADFGLAADADIAAAIKAQLDGELTVVAEPPVCYVDVQASLQASASCDAEVNPGSAEVKCTGGCDVDVQAPEIKCDTSADLQCTVVAPEVKCEGECHGTCELDLKAAAACSGTCNGDCSGACSAYVNDGTGAKCAGQCNGMCTGKCDFDLSANLKCEGSCKAECTTTNPSVGCKGAVRASCKAKDPSVGVKCDGHCDSKIIPPSAKAECQASAKASASADVQCTPPRVALSYKLKAGLDVAAKANFTVALTALGKVRLPALLAELKRADSVKQAGVDLVASASGAITTQFNQRMGDDKKYSVRTIFGIGCALGQLGDVKTILEKAGTDLGAQITAAGKLTSALKLSSS